MDRFELLSSDPPARTHQLRVLAQRAREANLRANLAAERLRTILEYQAHHRLLVWHTDSGVDVENADE